MEICFLQRPSGEGVSCCLDLEGRQFPVRQKRNRGWWAAVSEWLIGEGKRGVKAILSKLRAEKQAKTDVCLQGIILPHFDLTLLVLQLAKC
jgi:hypothetical protein